MRLYFQSEELVTPILAGKRILDSMRPDEMRADARVLEREHSLGIKKLSHRVEGEAPTAVLPIP